MLNLKNKNKFVLSGIAFALAGGLLTGCATTASEALPAAPEAPMTEETSVDHSAMHAEQNANMSAQSELYGVMRTLWSDHMYWTYITVDSFFNNQDALDASLTRLMQNQADLGDAIKGVYGDEAGDALTELLVEHIELAVPVLTAAAESDESGLEEGLTEWYRNASDIAEFLTAANPDFWPAEATDEMMRGHIDTTVTYAVDLLSQDYDAAIKSYTVAFDHMMEMSDALASGVIAQFPELF